MELAPAFCLVIEIDVLSHFIFHDSSGSIATPDVALRTPEQKHHIVEVIHADVQRLARHRVASHVVRCALKHSAPEDRPAENQQTVVVVNPPNT